MADKEKFGTPWLDDELDAIIVDYFTMLDAELSGRLYVKSHTAPRLWIESVGRIAQWNLSIRTFPLCLRSLDCQDFWLQAKRNYQGAIFDAIDRYLSVHGDILHRLPPKAGLPEKEKVVFVEPPPLTAKTERPWRLEKLVRKFDPVSGTIGIDRSAMR